MPRGATGSTRGDPRNVAALPPEVRPETGPKKELPPQFRRTLVDYYSKEPAGTIIVDTPNTYLYLVLGQGKALRYGIGVGREGFTWSGAEKVSKKAEWPDWNPPEQMIERQPYLPRFMAGGDGNPLGARALYLGQTIYRIHGTNQPSTIGTFVSSGCIRLTNEDITDLHSRVKVGTRVVVLPGRESATAVRDIGWFVQRDGVCERPAWLPSTSDAVDKADSSLGRSPRSCGRYRYFGLAGPAALPMRLVRLASPRRPYHRWRQELGGQRTTRRNARQSPGKKRPKRIVEGETARFATLPLGPRAIRTPPDSRSRAPGRFQACAGPSWSHALVQPHSVALNCMGGYRRSFWRHETGSECILHAVAAKAAGVTKASITGLRVMMMRAHAEKEQSDDRHEDDQHAPLHRERPRRRARAAWPSSSAS